MDAKKKIQLLKIAKISKMSLPIALIALGVTTKVKPFGFEDPDTWVIQ